MGLLGKLQYTMQTQYPQDVMLPNFSIQFHWTVLLCIQHGLLYYVCIR